MTASLLLLILSPSPLLGEINQACFDRLLGELRSNPEPWPPLIPTVTLQGETYHVGNLLGTATSDVYLTTDEEHVVKFFATNGKKFADYEYWVTQYLLEKDYDVPAVLHPPTLVTTEKGGVMRYVLIKKYLKGLNENERSRENLARIGTTREEFQAAYAEEQILFQSHFANQKFVEWLDAKGIDHSTWAFPKSMGDYGQRNVLLTPKGVKVHDP